MVDQAPGETLSARTFYNLSWSLSLSAASMSVQLVFTAVLARILAPEDFGLYAIAGVMVIFLQRFSQAGFSTALIQRREIDADDINTTFFVSLFGGCLLFGAIWVLSPAIAAFFHAADQEKLTQVLRAMALSFVLAGIGLTSLSLLRRELQVPYISVARFVSYLIGHGGVGIGMAVAGFGVWSLVGSALAQLGLISVFYLLRAGRHLRPRFHLHAFRRLVSFGGRLSVFRTLEFLSANIDTVIIGKLMAVAQLGIYNRAFAVASLPQQLIMGRASQVLFPAFSRVQAEQKRVRGAYTSTLTLGTMLLAPVCAGVAVAADEVILTILGGKWEAAIPVLRLLALAALLKLISQPAQVVCEALGELNFNLAVESTYVVLLGIVIVFLSPFGLESIAAGVLAMNGLRMLAFGSFIAWRLKMPVQEIARATAPGIITALVTAGAVRLVTLALHEVALAHWMILLCQIVTAGAVVGLCGLLLPFTSLRQELRGRVLRHVPYVRRWFPTPSATPDRPPVDAI